MSSLFQERISALITELKHQHGFPDRPEFEMPAPVHEADQREAEQLPLFRIATPSAPSRPRVWAPPISPEVRRSDTGQLHPMGYSEPCAGDPIRIADPKGGSRKRPDCALAEG